MLHAAHQLVKNVVNIFFYYQDAVNIAKRMNVFFISPINSDVGRGGIEPGRARLCVNRSGLVMQ